MKKIAVLLFMSWFACSCVEVADECENENEQSRMGLTVDSAREFFESSLQTGTRVGVDEALENQLIPGEISPRWAVADIDSDERLQCVDVPVDASYDYYQLCWGDEDETPSIYPVFRSLVVLKSSDSEAMAVYFRFFIPQAEFADYYAAKDPSIWATCNEQGRFSGTLLYTTLAGEPVAAGKYWNGRMYDSASVCGKENATKANSRKLGNLLNNIFLGRASRGANTRGIHDNNMIDVVVIIAERPRREEYDPTVDLDPFTPKNGGGGSAPSGGGSGSGVGDIPISIGISKSYEGKKNIKIDNERVKVLLDELEQDCAGETLISSLHSEIQIQTGGFGGSQTKKCVIMTANGELISVSYIINMGSRLDGFTLMEELIHVYQMTVNVNGGVAGRINLEVEAKLGWLRYNQRIGKKMDYDAILGKGGEEIFSKLGEFLTTGDTRSVAFYEAYRAAVQSLRTVGNYADESRYPDNPAQRNLDILQKTEKNC